MARERTAAGRRKARSLVRGRRRTVAKSVHRVERRSLTRSQADERFALVWSDGGAAHLWSLERHRVVGSYAGHSGRLVAGALALARHQLLTAGIDGTIICWGSRTGTRLFTLGRQPIPPIMR